MAFNFTYPQGTDYILTVSATDEGGVALDLTGYTFKGQFRKSYEGKLEFSFTFEQLDQITYPGKFKAKIADNAITTILSEPIEMVYDIEIKSPAGLVTRILEGRCTITPEVTR